MKITVNGTPTEVNATILDSILAELGHGEARIATAVNEMFVPAAKRPTYSVEPGDRLEILAPRQGG